MSARGPSVITDANSELHTVVDAFTKFLTVATHQILHARNIYPAKTFIRAKDYGLAVYQSRHPDVCKFINSEIADIHQKILSGTVRRIFVAIFVQGLPRERFVSDITRMSILKSGTIGEKADFETPFPLVDAEEQMRAVLSKLKYHCASLEPLDDQSTFRMVMEVDEGPMQGPDNEQHGKDISNTITDDTYCTGEDATNMVKIRSVEAGRLVFDLWYEAAQVPTQQCTYVPSQPLTSDGAPSSPSDLYGTFPSTRVGYIDDQQHLDKNSMVDLAVASQTAQPFLQFRLHCMPFSLLVPSSTLSPTIHANDRSTNVASSCSADKIGPRRCYGTVC